MRGTWHRLSLVAAVSTAACAPEPWTPGDEPLQIDDATTCGLPSWVESSERPSPDWQSTTTSVDADAITRGSFTPAECPPPCPSPAQLVCDSYTPKIGCICDDARPAGPEGCASTTQFACEYYGVSADDPVELDPLFPYLGCDCSGPADAATCAAQGLVLDCLLEDPPSACTCVDPPPMLDCTAPPGGAPANAIANGLFYSEGASCLSPCTTCIHAGTGGSNDCTSPCDTDDDCPGGRSCLGCWDLRVCFFPCTDGEQCIEAPGGGSCENGACLWGT